MFFQRFYRESGQDVTVKITRGATLRSVAIELEHEQVIYNKYPFIAAGRLLGYQDEIIPGEYKFPNGLTNIDVLKMITDLSLNRALTITIPEGLNVRHVAHLLSRLADIDSAKFVRETFNDSLINLLDIEADNLEGFLFPDTYQFILSRRGNNEHEIICAMADQFRKKITPEMLDAMKQRKLTLKEVITVATPASTAAL